jgi:hypothetical protein
MTHRDRPELRQSREGIRRVSTEIESTIAGPRTATTRRTPGDRSGEYQGIAGEWYGSRRRTEDLSGHLAPGPVGWAPPIRREGRGRS